MSDRPPLRLEYIDPNQLASNPLNPKFHPPEQLDAIDELIGSVGWAGAMLYNERTHRLLDGHGRKERMAGKGPVPVLVGSWDEAQERKILAFLDSTGYMAKVDAGLLEALTAAELMPLDDSPHLAELLGSLRQAAELLDDQPPGVGSVPAADGGGAGDHSNGARPPSASDTPDAIWPTDNPWGVPVLDLALQADALEFPVCLWGTQGQSRAMRGTWVFYSQDSAFEPLWSNPGKVLPSGAPALVEPNYSTHDQTPLAADLWGIYRRRWLARYWQSQGRRVWVDLNVHHRLLAEHEATPGFIPAFLGVPKGWRAFASRAHANRPEMLIVEHEAAVKHSGCDSINFFVYGGGKRVEQLARERGWFWVPEHNDTIKAKTDAAGSQPSPE